MWSVRFVCVWALLCSPSLGQSTAQSATQQPPSYGTVFADDFNKNLEAVEKNLYKGVVGVTDPVFKFAVDTAPNLAQLYALFNGVNVPPGLANFGKELYGKAAVGGGKILGTAAVVGSSVLGNGLGTFGQFLEATNGALQSGLKIGNDFTDGSDAAVKGASAANGALTALGDALIAAGSSTNNISDGISQIINTITASLVLAIQSAHKIATDVLDAKDSLLKNGPLDSKSQNNIKNLLNTYVQILSNIQDLFSNFIKNIMGAAANNSINSTSGAATSTAP